MRIVPLIAAPALVIAFAAPVSGATWGPPVPLAADFAWAGDLATAGSVAIVSFEMPTDSFSELYVRRSTDGGLTWKPRVLISATGGLADLAARGSSFDVVYNTPDGRTKYRRSSNGGQTFSSPESLSPAGRYTWGPQVARGAGGLVAIGFIDVLSYVVTVRVSDDGGQTFGSGVRLTDRGAEATLSLAIGDGVIYALYDVDGIGTRLRRSLDGGATWTRAVTLLDPFYGGRSLIAAGSRAFIAYDASNDPPNWTQVRYRATSDKGASWSSSRAIGPRDWTTRSPVISFRGGVVRALFARCTPSDDTCDDDRTFYRQLTLGGQWTTPVRISPDSLYEGIPVGVGYTDRAIVYYLGNSIPYVRVGTP